jgi:hypothetical protein
MGAEKGRLLPGAERCHSVDIVVTVALDVLEAEQRHQSEVLLQGESRLRREIPLEEGPGAAHEEIIGVLRPERPAFQEADPGGATSNFQLNSGSR